MKHYSRILWLPLALLAAAAYCPGQEPVAPTPETVGPVRGDNLRDYNIVNSFETGYRFVSVSGNEAMYRAQENYGNGVRLLSGYLGIDSKDGHGRFFDKIMLSTQGLGGDPYESASVSVQKNRLYEYDLLWRVNDYVNPGLTTDGGNGIHLLDTSYTLQDHNLTIFPQSRIRFSLGYTRDSQTGDGISTVQLFNTTGQFDQTANIFPLFGDVKRVQNEYRVGAEFRYLGFTLNLLYGLQDFKDDTPFEFTGSSSGDNANSNTTLNSFFRAAPEHGTTPWGRLGLFYNNRWINFNGRFTYSSGARAFVSNENAIGTNRFGAAANQQILTFGDARRPVATGNATVSIFPARNITLVNQTSVYNVRTDGNSAYLQFDNATQAANLLYFQSLGIRTIANDTDLVYQMKSWLNWHAGYEYSNRRINSSPQFVIAGGPATAPFSQTNELNSGVGGVRIRPISPLTISLDAEIGRASRPFTPRSERDYHALNGRIQYKLKSLQLVAAASSDYNDNSVSLSAYSSHARTYSATASWNPKHWIGFDAAYAKLHLDTLGGIAFFADSVLFPNQVSYFVSNLHSGTLNLRMNFKRADLYVGYSRVQDTGDGRASPVSTVAGPNLPAFQTAQTFPLKFQSPSARLSFRISERVRWNFGYQYFGYRESFFSGENYLAHTGYTSVLWSF